MNFGEVDFVVVNRSGELLLIEQKNGTVEQVGGRLIKNYGHGSSKNVGFQIRRSVDVFKERLKSSSGPGLNPPIDYLVYLPDYRLVSASSSEIQNDRIIDAAKDSVKSTSLEARIQACLGPGKESDAPTAGKIHAFLEQSFEVVPDIHAHEIAGERSFARLGGTLVKFVDSIEMSPLRLRISGTAGCGKSLLALRAYRQAVTSGRHPLLVCFNRPLADSLAAAAGPGGMVTTWHALCARFLEDSGQKLDFSRMSDLNFWKDVESKVIAETIPENWTFDTIIVDEGQDFENEWYQILRLFARGEPDILWLEDDSQNVYGKPSVTLPGFVRLNILDNYRTPVSIARFIQRLLPFQFDIASEMPGLGVNTTATNGVEDERGKLIKILSDLRKMGFGNDDIVLLSAVGHKRSSHVDINTLGTFGLRKFTGYDNAGKQLYTPGNIVFDTVFRFKGQQAPAIVLFDIEGAETDPRLQRILFTAMTRATVRLEIVIPKNGHWLSLMRSAAAS